MNVMNESSIGLSINASSS